MRNAFLSYWNYGTTFSGIEVVTLNGRKEYLGVTATKKKGEFNNFKFVKGASFKDIAVELPKNQHTHLVLNIDGVLIKETPKERDQQKAIGKAFPGLSLTDFYFDVFESNERVFIAVARKELVESVLKEAQDAGIGALSFQLGFGSLQGIASLIPEDVIYAGRYELGVVDGKLASFKENSHPKRNYRVEDVQVSSEHLFATSGLLRYLSPDFSANEERNASLKKDYTEKNFFRKGLVVGVGIILACLLINTFFFFDYGKQYQNLKEQAEVASEQQKILMARTESVEKKEYVVENILNSGHSKSSFYLNRVVSQRPGSILFSDIQFQPLLKSIRPNKKVEYERDVMTFAGDSYDREEFSSWIQELEALPWVSNVTVLQYGQAQGKSNYFEIKIAVLHDTEE